MNRPVVRVARFALAGTAAVCMACSAAVSPTQRTESTYVPGGGAGGGAALLSVNADNGSIGAVIGAPLQAIWRILPTAFDSAGVPLTLIDPKKHLMANEGFKVRQKLGTERLSTYFECGTTQVGPNADSYELYVTVYANLERLKSDTTRTSMTVAITAAAKPLQFAQDYSRCTSKTSLERKMLDVVARAVQR
jgi:hypothetical protein